MESSKHILRDGPVKLTKSQTKQKGINVQKGLMGRTEFIEVGREIREGKDIEIN